MRWSILLLALPLALAAPTGSGTASPLLTVTSGSVPVATLSTTSAAASTTATASSGDPSAHPSVQIYPDSSNGNAVTITGVNYPLLQQDVYLGIPYAAPPVGNLRFSPPQDYQYNFSVTAQRPPPACLQNTNSTGGTTLPTSEDCLFLNVYAPQGATGQTAWLPVMVWVHGGSFTAGDATSYNASLIEAMGAQTDRPFIFVALQYRLGVFGWGYGSGFGENNAGNLGLKDIKKGLDWVHTNIWAFGGNPDQVTVFGESAGAIAISLLYLDENVKTFRSAIMESGAQSTLPLGPTGSTWEGAYQYLLKATGCVSGGGNSTASNSTSVATNATATQSPWQCLQNLPADQLLQGQLAVKANPLYQGGFVYGPSIDGDIIPDSPHTLLSQGKFAKIPFITGNNKDEGTGFIPSYVNTTAIAVIALGLIEPEAIDNATIAQLFSLYPEDPAFGSPFGTGNETFGRSPTFKRLSAIFGDAQFQATRRYFLHQANQYGLADTWTYQFEQLTPGRPGYLGVYHGSEIPFVFGASRPGVTLPGFSANYTAADAQLSNTMVDYWLNFAYYTDPNGNGSGSGGGNGTRTDWPRHNEQDRSIIRFKSDNVTVFTDDYRRQQTDFFLSEPDQFNYKRALAGQ
ncbi:hypothetical protein IAU60_001796 [Kwoniella sp. DSM 27419]